MKIFTAEDIRKLDAATIQLEPVASVDLMERAAFNAFRKIKMRIDPDKVVNIFAGTGNNGGDGLVLARLLASENYNVRVFVIETGASHSNDMEINLGRLNEVSIKPVIITTYKEIPECGNSEVIIDAIFGSGLTRPPSGLAAEVIQKINSSGAFIISIDIPSGLFCEDNSEADRNTIIKASYTITFQFPKLAFMFAGNSVFTGEWEVIDIGLHKETIAKMPTRFYYLEPSDVRPILRKRKKFDHKGSYGHVLLIAGSYGKAGAAILTAGAALRTGAGLVTLHVPKSAIIPVQSALPEAMVSPDPGEEIVTSIPEMNKYDSVGIGPGLGTDPDTREAFAGLLEKYRGPVVIDADALNILSHDRRMLQLLPPNSILTPHPGEFKRLTGNDLTDYKLLISQQEFAEKYNCIVILKGACTSIAYPDGRLFFNSTGNSGMATAGSGDVLTGMITSLLGQQYNPEQAALAGVSLHGLAGDCALEKQSEESLIAGDIVNSIGNAFRVVSLNHDN